MTNNPDRIEREVEQARDELAQVITQLADRLDPKKVTGEAKNWVGEKINQPPVKYSILGASGLVSFAALRRLVRRKKP